MKQRVTSRQDKVGRVTVRQRRRSPNKLLILRSPKDLSKVDGFKADCTTHHKS